VHEAAHALAAELFYPGTLVGVKIHPGGGGCVWTAGEEPPGGKRAYRRLRRNAEDRLADVNTMTAQVGPIPPAIAAKNIADCRARAAISMAGLLAERLIFGLELTPRLGSADVVEATSLCRRATYSRAGSIALLKYVEIDTKVLLERHRTALLAIACELEVKGKLTGAEVAKLVVEHPPSV
jgi:hypothetical protein